jgi:hypothetical protein
MVNKELRTGLTHFRHEKPPTGQVIEVPAQEVFWAGAFYGLLIRRRQDLPSGINGHSRFEPNSSLAWWFANEANFGFRTLAACFAASDLRIWHR